MQKMNLVNADESDEIRIAGVGSFPCDHVPFFRRGHDNLRLRNLLLCELPVAREL